jgi:hypothetical protein
MALTPKRADVKVGKFDAARVFPPGDQLTYPLFRLMLATDDARCATLLFVMADRQVRDTAGAEQALHAGRMWYLFRLLCSHLSEAGNALGTLMNSVPRDRLRKLLRGRPIEVDALERLRDAFGKGTLVRSVRDSVGSHYRQADIARVYEADLKAGRVDGSLIACEVGGLSRFTITDVLALRLMDDAAGATTHEEFSSRLGQVTQLADELSTAVGHLVAALVEESRVVVTIETVEVPALYRAAREWAENELRAGSTTPAGESGRKPESPSE